MFRYFGHNCFSFTSNGTSLLIDPWFSNKGAFFGSWFQYPQNHQLKSDALKSLVNRENSYVYITHEHQDHFDEDTLEECADRATFVIPAFKDDFLKRHLSRLGAQVVELQDKESLRLGDRLWVQCFIIDVGVNHDSALLVECETFTFFNQNDCKIFDRLGEIEKQVDFYSVQFSGATSHPVCYDYSASKKKKLSQEKNEAKFHNVCRAIQDLKPRFYIPAAGPAIFPFLEPSLSLGQGTIFVHQDELQRHLLKQGVHNVAYLRPGEVFEDGVAKDQPIPPPTSDELLGIRDSLINVWGQLSNPFDVHNLVLAVQSRLDQIRDLKFDDCPIIQFTWGTRSDQSIVVDLNAGTVAVGKTDKKRFIELRAEEKYFALMADQKYRWQDISLSLRASVSRKPDVFSNFANIFLFSDPSNIRDAFISSINRPKARITVRTSQGNQYQIDRFCPHQGADLTCAVIDSQNTLTCPRHGWRFRLDEGGINRQAGTTINARLVSTSPDKKNT